MYMLHSNKKSIALVTETALHTVLTLSPLLIHFFFFNEAVAECFFSICSWAILEQAFAIISMKSFLMFTKLLDCKNKCMYC